VHPLRTTLGATSPAAGDTLVEMAARGDRVAFEQLVESRVDRIFRTACAILGNEADAHDATQEAFIAAWVQLPRLRDSARFDAWLNRVILNACRDSLRRRRRSREVDLGAFERAAPDAQSEVADRASFNSAFERLGAADRSILVLHHLHQMSLIEMAGQLGVPIGTVKSRLHTARRALERALEAEA
jgi:RNA polymerase sigma-70 factor (ECF subfamily)